MVREYYSANRLGPQREVEMTQPMRVPEGQKEPEPPFWVKFITPSLFILAIILSFILLYMICTTYGTV